MKAIGRNSRKKRIAVRVGGKTCGKVLAGLAVYAGRGFLTEEGAAALEDSKRKPTLTKSPFQSLR